LAGLMAGEDCGGLGPDEGDLAREDEGGFIKGLFSIPPKEEDEAGANALERSADKGDFGAAPLPPLLAAPLPPAPPDELTSAGNGSMSSASCDPDKVAPPIKAHDISSVPMPIEADTSTDAVLMVEMRGCSANSCESKGSDASPKDGPAREEEGIISAPKDMFPS